MNKFTKSRLYYVGIQRGMQTQLGKLFLCVLSLFTIMFLCYLIYAHYTHTESQKKIKQCYVEHIAKADSLYMHLLTYNKEMAIVKQKTSDAILADSLIKSVLINTQYLSKVQSKKLQFIIESHFNEVEKLHNKYEEKLLRDSLRLCTERELLDGQTKAMIDLHLNKVEHEYSNITIWGAALTILFLVFSFYSLYKIDELIKQGNEGLKDIRNIKRSGEKLIDKLEKNSNSLLERTEESIGNFISEQQNRMQQTFEMSQEAQNRISALHGDMQESLAKTKDEFDRQSLNILQEFKNEKDTLLNEEESKFDLKQKELDDLIKKANYLFEQLNKYPKDKKMKSHQTMKNRRVKI